eukprot:4670945-Pleurochrysis_carterae.AAC.2
MRARYLAAASGPSSHPWECAAVGSHISRRVFSICSKHVIWARRVCGLVSFACACSVAQGQWQYTDYREVHDIGSMLQSVQFFSKEPAVIVRRTLMLMHAHG